MSQNYWKLHRCQVLKETEIPSLTYKKSGYTFADIKASFDLIRCNKTLKFFLQVDAKRKEETLQR